MEDRNKPYYDASDAKYIDHTVLKCATTQETVKRFCDETKEDHFASVCVNPTHVSFVHAQLSGSGVAICCVIGFPLGATTTLVKTVETVEAIKNGADDVDVVINIDALKDRRLDEVLEDIKSVVKAVHAKALVKVILETSDLTDEEKTLGCELAVKARADFVKTSSGFGMGGATVEDLTLMKRTVGGKAKIKASTGINCRADADRMIRAGAVRLGTSKGIQIITGE